MKRFMFVAALAVLVAIAGPMRSEATGIFCVTGGSSSGLGDCSGDLSFNQATGVLTIQLTNDSPLANGGYFVGMSFQIPGEPDLLTYIDGSFTSSDPDFVLGTLPEHPFGLYDIGTKNEGSPTDGIAPGQSVTFTFSFSPTGSGLVDTAFFADKTIECGSQGAWGCARFKGFENGGSDKVPLAATARPVAEPSVLMLLGSGLIGITLAGRKKLLS
jgi:hypothetical protein